MKAGISTDAMRVPPEQNNGPETGTTDSSSTGFTGSGHYRIPISDYKLRMSGIQLGLSEGSREMISNIGSRGGLVAVIPLDPPKALVG
ncbi:hypothetical protein Lesp01_90530 [Lentzea sp. NBRC 102530]|nr:hypothetical protein Lesp01_90530 [Lentzea sp. NBRC 102530]